jgi:long-chain acyl-CoA synthetase
MSSLNTIPQLFLDRTAKSAGRQAVGWIENGKIQSWDYTAYRQTVEAFSLALRKHGLQPQEKIAILSSTRREWNVTDLAAQCARGVVVPVYPSYLPDEVAFIVKHSESCMIAVEDDVQLTKVLRVFDELPPQKLLVAFSPIGDSLRQALAARKGPILRTFAELLEEGAAEMATHPDTFEETIRNQPPKDISTIIYTSGTTGEPKGAVITQYAWSRNLQNAHEFLGAHLNEKDTILTYLPLSHVYGRQDSFLILVFGWRMVFAESLDKLIGNIAIVRPSIMAAVPRVLEKIYAGINKQVESGSGIKRAIFHWALRVANEYHAAMDRGETPGGFLAWKHRLATKLVFSKIQQRFGGRLRFFISGSAPLAPEIIYFLRNLGLTIMEGYGLTESLSGCCINPVEKQIPGTVGRPFPHTEIKIADDGEILIRGEALFTEYYKRPEATAEALRDGWFYTGDIGEFTPEGYLKITDRKKDLIKTSGGKYIVPQRIEGMVKAQKYGSQIVVVGDKRNYATALIGVDKEKLRDALAALGMNANCSVADLANSVKVHDLVQKDIDVVNAKLAKFETIKKFYICPEEFTIDGGLLTPSLKVKKKVALERYKSEIDAMYAGGGGAES